MLPTSVSVHCVHSSYDHEGRLTNVTRPTGVVTSLHREMEKSITIDIENSNRDDDVTVITNLSSVEASYTVVQGKPLPTKLTHRPQASLGGPPEPWNTYYLAILLKCPQKTNSTRGQSCRK